MTTEQALSILDQATQPGKALTRADYAVVQQALEVLAKLVNEQKSPEEPKP